MANNRLWIVNTATNEYLMIAKSFVPWEARFDADELTEFLTDVYEGSDVTAHAGKVGDISGPHPFILVSESDHDRELYEKHIANGKRFKSWQTTSQNPPTEASGPAQE